MHTTGLQTVRKARKTPACSAPERHHQKSLKRKLVQASIYIKKKI